MTFCPATMCPLFAEKGSPWTGDKNMHCLRDGCGWWWAGQKHCMGMLEAGSQVTKAKPTGYTPPTTYDCERAHECQWQIQAGEKLCPPRLALSVGLNPRVVAN